jgi:hypothetical protein
MVTVDYMARLELVQAAISGLLAGGMASYKIDGQEVTKLDLDWLSREESRLVAKINRAARAGGTFRQAVPR